jgi:hypothetical protein
MSFILYLAMQMNLTSKIDWVVTRYYRVKEWFHSKFWKAGITDKTPPCELDLTDLLDKADRQNKIMGRY